MENEIKNKQNRKVTIFALFLSLVSVGVLVFGFLLVSSNKVILLQSVSNIYNKINIFHDNNIPILDKIATSKNIGIKSEISVKTNEELFKMNVNYLENTSSARSRLDLIIKYLDEEILNGNAILEDNKFYLFLKDITENYYYTDLDYESFIRSLSTSDYNKIMEAFKDSVIEVVKNDDIKKEKVTITYNGKDKKVNKLSYRIGYKQINKMVETFVKNIKNDKKLYKNIATCLEIETEDLDKIIDSFTSLIPDEDKKVVEYDVYYYGFNKIIRYEFKILSNDLIISYQENKDKKEAAISVSEKELINLTFKSDKDVYDYVFTLNNPLDNSTYAVSGTYEKGKLVVKYDDNKLVINSTNSEKENSYTNNSEITLSDKDGNSITIGINTTCYFDEEVKFNSNNSVDISDITPEEMETIMNNFMESKLYEVLSGNQEIVNMIGIDNMFLKEE